MAIAWPSSTPLTAPQPLYDGEAISTIQFFRSFRWSLYPPPPFVHFSCSPIFQRRTAGFIFRMQATSTTTKTLGRRTPVVSDGGYEDQIRPVCPGCGVLCRTRPQSPRLYRKPTVACEPDGFLSDADDELLEEEEEEEEEELDGVSSGESDIGSDLEELPDEVGAKVKGRLDSDWDSDWDLEEDEDSKWKKELDGFALPGVGYGNTTEETLKKWKKERISKAEKKRKMREAMRNESTSSVTVCARCHCLRNYGQVKNPTAENLIPDFDFDGLVATKLIKPSTSAPVVVIVVDCVDFDGSFPKRAAKSLFKALERSKAVSKVTKLPKLVLVATKVDLLPQQISPARLDKWVRRRAKAAGASKLDAVYMVSARKDLGVRNLLSCIKDLAGPRGNVWVIGAQNAGKSTLINSIAKKEGVKVTRLTEAPVPGTTLGILRITGILPAMAKMYDTPGLLHPYLMTVRLNMEELKMVEIRKELQPRTYRVKVGQTVHVGGLMRLDLTRCSAETIYVTVWASPRISLHLGKIDHADDLRSSHAGVRLQPPLGRDRLTELGEWKATEFIVSGTSWEANSVDISVSGVGWFSLGMKCEAKVVLWTFDGVQATKREPLVLDRAPFIQRPGFLLPKGVSMAIGNQVKMEARGRRREVEEDDFI
ncbi:hypothetical protein HPP92_003074 [Vanilla planifolia]|uniref:CP-type G domain-containing protein n=1 Tax=Vanilla planifolia TaxID=51239 RepID=A0A835VIJ6_VANPL|nr:hypothetical protein HPP92_003074 [Vanilla planifolia]